MPRSSKVKTRPYDSSARQAGAAQRRERILGAAKRAFEKQGWQGATIPLIARRAGVSHQTVEALFGTKAALLQAVVDYSIRGDASPVRMQRRQAVADMEAVPTAAGMLDLHAAQVRSISERTAGIAWTVEHAASSDRRVASQWRRMTENRRFGVDWATRTLLAKPDIDETLQPDHVASTFWLALDWNTYRSLTRELGLSPQSFEKWLREYYRRMFGA